MGNCFFIIGDCTSIYRTLSYPHIIPGLIISEKVPNFSKTTIDYRRWYRYGFCIYLPSHKMYLDQRREIDVPLFSPYLGKSFMKNWTRLVWQYSRYNATNKLRSNSFMKLWIFSISNIFRCFKKMMRRTHLFLKIICPSVCL